MNVIRDKRPPTLGISNLMFLNGTDQTATQRRAVGPMMAVLVVGGLLWMFINEARGR